MSNPMEPRSDGRFQFRDRRGLRASSSRHDRQRDEDRALKVVRGFLTHIKYTSAELEADAAGPACYRRVVIWLGDLKAPVATETILLGDAPAAIASALLQLAAERNMKQTMGRK